MMFPKQVYGLVPMICLLYGMLLMVVVLRLVGKIQFSGQQSER